MRVGIMLRHIQERGGIVTYSQNMLKGFLQSENNHEFAMIYADKSMLGTYSDHKRVTEHVIDQKKPFCLGSLGCTPRLADKLGLDLIYNPKLSVPLWARQKRVLTLRPEQFVHPELFSQGRTEPYFKIFMPLYCNAASRILAPAKSSRLDIIKLCGCRA